MSKKFCVGDRVSFGGLKGTVVSVTEEELYPVNVKWDSGEAVLCRFTLDGRIFHLHTKPLLKKLVKRKKKKEPVPEDLDFFRGNFAAKVSRAINWLLAEARRRRGE